MKSPRSDLIEAFGDKKVAFDYRADNGLLKEPCKSTEAVDWSKVAIVFFFILYAEICSISIDKA